MASQVKVAIVTGGSSGVGSAAALLLAEAGYSLALVARHEDRLEATRELIQTRLGRSDVLTLPHDMADPDAPGDIVASTLERFGHIDALVNNVGYAPLGPIDEIAAEEWRKTIDINLTSAVLMTAAVWPHFKHRETGVIVNTSSLASIDPFDGFSMYATAKAGLNMFTQCTASEGKAIGVKAAAIAPGAVETPMLRELFTETAIPREKTLDPAAVATVIRDCITGERKFKPGEVIEIPSG